MWRRPEGSRRPRLFPVPGDGDGEGNWEGTRILGVGGFGRIGDFGKRGEVVGGHWFAGEGDLAVAEGDDFWGIGGRTRIFGFVGFELIGDCVGDGGGGVDFRGEKVCAVEGDLSFVGDGDGFASGGEGGAERVAEGRRGGHVVGEGGRGRGRRS